MTPEQNRLIATTFQRYVFGAEDAIMRNRKLLALLKARGKVTMNNSGTKVDWGIKFKRAPVSGWAENDVLTFTQRNRWKRAELEWRGYVVTDSITKHQKEMNKGNEALIKITGEIAENLMDDMDEEFGNELYIDGNATGNSRRLHGIESFMGTDGTISGVPVGQPHDTYANLSTNLGDDGGAGGGTWANGTWPNGSGDAHYDFWSPLIVDYTNALWPQSTKTWAYTCETALRYGIVKGRKNKSMKNRTDVIVMEDELYRLFLEKQSAKERINIARNDGAKPTLQSLGYSDVFNFEGTEITSEFGVPVNTAYGWCMEYLELMSLQSKLFVPTGPDYSITTDSDRFKVDFLGNLKFRQIRYFTKWKNLS
jgi:hypothetical protein